MLIISCQKKFSKYRTSRGILQVDVVLIAPVSIKARYNALKRKQVIRKAATRHEDTRHLRKVGRVLGILVCCLHQLTTSRSQRMNET